MFKDAKGEISSKRIIGAVIIFYVLLVITIAELKGVDLKPNITGLLTTLSISGAAMISAGVIENKINK